MPTNPAIHGAILGTIIGDAIGLPYEALPKRRGIRLLGPSDRHRFIFGHGMMSDDGEHTCMVAQSMCDAGGDFEIFRRALARRFRWWLLGIPAGIGGATLRAIFKLWLGISALRSGVFSAGNGPAMRSAVIGVSIEDPQILRSFVQASTRITHTDPKAFFGAMAVAIAAKCASKNLSTAPDYLDAIRAALPEAEASKLMDLISRVVHSIEAKQTTSAFAENLGCKKGVSGYIYQTVPVAVHAWLSHPTDYAAGVQTAIECGGDTDTVAAITGAILGSAVGAAGIPDDWKENLMEWPRSLLWIEQLADALDQTIQSGTPTKPPRVGISVITRNAIFLLGLAGHLIRRALPPY